MWPAHVQATPVIQLRLPPLARAKESDTARPRPHLTTHTHRADTTPAHVRRSAVWSARETHVPAAPPHGPKWRRKLKKRALRRKQERGEARYLSARCCRAHAGAGARAGCGRAHGGRRMSTKKRPREVGTRSCLKTPPNPGLPPRPSRAPSSRLALQHARKTCVKCDSAPFRCGDLQLLHRRHKHTRGLCGAEWTRMGKKKGARSISAHAHHVFPMQQVSKPIPTCAADLFPQHTRPEGRQR